MILKVVQQGQPYTVPSTKSENGQTQKCNMVLQRLGGPFEDQFLVTLWGNDALVRYDKDDLVVAVLRFSTHEYNSGQGMQTFQDITVKEIHKWNGVF